jgi:leucyl-tRNA synthetase
MDDPDWRGDNAADIQGKLVSLRKLALDIIDKAKGGETGHLEKWLLSKMQQRTGDVTRNLDELKTRTALEIALFEVWNDFRWYTRRKGETEAAAVKEALEVWLRLLAPFAPHICEELWSAAGKESFISLAKWPRVDESKIDIEAEEQENLITEIIDDTLNILKATKITPKSINYYIAASWKWQVQRKILEKAAPNVGEVMKELAAHRELKSHMKDAVRLFPKVAKAVTKLSSERKANMLKIQSINEKEVIANALGFLKERFNAKVAVYDEEDQARFDPKHRAALAVPGQPAIYIE